MYLLTIDEIVRYILMYIYRPLWTYHKTEWQDNNVYPSFGISILSPKVVAAMFLPMLCLTLFGLLLEAGSKHNRVLCSPTAYSKMMLARIIAIVVIVMEIILVIIVLGSTETSRIRKLMV